MAAPLEETAKKRFCSSDQQSGSVSLEDAEVVPTKIFPGEQINHRLRYVVCPFAPAQTVQGKIMRTVKFEEKKIFEDVTEHAFKLGSWIVDASIIVPDEAENGKYILDVTIMVGKSLVRKGNTFLVKKRGAP